MGSQPHITWGESKINDYKKASGDHSAMGFIRYEDKEIQTTSEPEDLLNWSQVLEKVIVGKGSYAVSNKRATPEEEKELVSGIHRSEVAAYMGGSRGDHPITTKENLRKEFDLDPIAPLTGHEQAVLFHARVAQNLIFYPQLLGTPNQLIF